MDVAVEIYWSTAGAAGATCAREEIAGITGDPLAAVQRRYREHFPGDAAARRSVVDSSSWHYDAANDRLVVSYLVHGADLPVATLPNAVGLDWDVLRSRNRLSTDPLAPHRSEVNALSVYRHALRHLAYEVATDPAIRAAVGGDPAIAAAIESLDPRATTTRRVARRPRWHSAQGRATVPRVAVETFYTHLDGAAGLLDAVRVQAPLADATDPTEALRAEYSAVYPERPLDAGDTLLHSTSWRYEPSTNTLLLTYVIAAPDLDVSRAAAALGADEHRVPLSGIATSWTRAAGGVRDGEALAQAVSHLAYLADRDPTVSRVLSRDPATRAALEAIGEVPSGELRASSLIA